MNSTRPIHSLAQRWLIFIVAASLFFLSQFYRASNAVIAPLLLQDLSLDTEGLGLMSAAFFYAFAFTQIPISLLLDKIGARSIMTTLTVTGVLGAILFSWADGLVMALVGRVLMGAGMACNLMGTLKLLTRWFAPPSFATLSGVIFAIGTLGNMVATTPLVILVEHLGWRVSFQLIASINLLLVLVFYCVVRDHPPRPAAPQAAPVQPSITLSQAFANLGRLLRQKDYWIISAGTLVRYGVFAAFQVLWAGPFLMEVLGYPPRTAGNLILLLNFGIIIGAPLWGSLSDHFFKTRKAVIITGLASSSLTIAALLTVSPMTPPAIVSLLFFGFGFFNGAGMLMYPHIKERMPLEMAGVAMTGINFFTMIGAAVFLQGLGSLMQTLYPQASRGSGAFNAVFWLCSGCLLAVSGLYLLTRENRR